MAIVHVAHSSYGAVTRASRFLIGFITSFATQASRAHYFLRRDSSRTHATAPSATVASPESPTVARGPSADREPAEHRADAEQHPVEAEHERGADVRREHT